MGKDALHPTSQLVGANEIGRLVLDSVTAEIAVLDANGKIVYVNQAWRSFSDSNGGAPDATGVGANYLEVCRRASGEDALLASEACRGIQDVLGGVRKTFVLEYPCHSPTCNRWFLLYVSPLKGTQNSAVVSHVSITDRKAMEERLVTAERLAAIGQAMAGLSHEGRKSLQRSQASIDLLRLHLANDADALELLERIGQAQDRLLGVYEDARSYAAPVAIRYETCALGDLVAELLSTYASHGPLVRLSQTPFDGSLDCEIDIGGIRQVLQLALDNAMEVSVESSEVNVSYRAGTLDGLPAITIIVSDDGPGIPKEDRDKVFDPFYTTKPNGTGLGLAICKRIVSAHGGNIRFDEPLFGGASIYITLPIHRRRATDTPQA